MKNTLSSCARSKALAVALGIVFALPMMAHAEFKGKFTLTTETHWGPAVLAPGNYDFVLDSISAPTKIVVRESDGKVAAILISMWSAGTSHAKSNTLELETHGSSTFVSAVYLRDAETELHFNVPKVKEDVLADEAMKTKSATMTASAQ